MSVQVIDATALAALIFGEPAAEAIAERIQHSELITPEILRGDLAEICMYKIIHDGVAPDLCLAAMRLLDGIGLRYIEQAPADVIRFALERQLTTREAYYVRLAESVDTELVSLNVNLMERREERLETA